MRGYALALAVAVAVGAAGCSDNGPAPCAGCNADLALPPGPKLERIFPGATDGGAPATFSGCVWASPLAVDSQGARFVLAASADGTVAGIDPASGEVSWRVQLPAPAGEEPFLLPTPVVVGTDLFVAYAQRDVSTKARNHHVVAAIDLEARALDPSFPTVELFAQKAGTPSGTVTFEPTTQVARSQLVHAVPPGQAIGDLYVSLGNIQDIQPWHGWVFELDLDAWKAGGAAGAIHSALLTTTQSDCGPPGMSGSRETRCGGGVWAPSGPVAIQAGATYELIVPTGNGLLDLASDNFGNTLMRTGPGLAFTPGCDPTACAGFDGLDPARPCLDSCSDLFVPRLLPGDPPEQPESGACDGKTLLQCYEALDWDLGANSPALALAADALVLPGKDGAVYLIDHAKLGTLLDRRPIAQPCGTKTDPCTADWAGMMVTEPLLLDDPAGPIAVIPTFEYDATHPGGVVALRVTGTGSARKLAPLWSAPDAASKEAVAQFRGHPGRAQVTVVDGEPYVWVVDVAGQGGHGLFYGIRASDGSIVERAPLAGAGQRYVQPLYEQGALYVASCASDDGPGSIEGYRVAAP